MANTLNIYLEWEIVLWREIRKYHVHITSHFSLKYSLILYFIKSYCPFGKSWCLSSLSFQGEFSVSLSLVLYHHGGFSFVSIFGKDTLA